MKTNTLALSDADTPLVSNNQAGKILRVLTLVVTNKNSDSVAFSADILRSGESFKILNRVTLRGGKSMSVFVSKDFGVFLEEGDQLRLSSPFAGVEAVCSYEAVDHVNGPAPQSEVTVRFLAPTKTNRGWGDGNEEQEKMPDDIVHSIVAQTYNGEEVEDFASVKWNKGRQAFVVSLNPAYVLDGSVEATFQLNVNDPRYRPHRVTYSLSNPGTYTTSMISCDPLRPGTSEPSQESVDFLCDYLAGFWTHYESGSSEPYPLPESTPAEFGAFYPLEHAYQKLLLNTPTEGYASEEEYILGNIEAIKAYSLDPDVIRWLYNIGTSKRIELDSTMSAQTTVSNKGMRPAADDRNFLGVSWEVFRCITRGEGPGGPLYKGTKSRPQTYTGGWFGGNDNAFDCRSFAECGAIAMTAKLRAICPLAKVHRVGIHRHLINKVELGGVCADGNPCPCCEGSFIYEPQTGHTWDDMQSYCGDDWPCTLPWYPDGEMMDDNEDTPWPNGTGWEEYPAEVERIASVICGCVMGQPPSNESEEILQQQCTNGTMGDWFKENFAFNDESKNGPGKEPSLPLPNDMSCNKYSCHYRNGFVEDEENGMYNESLREYCQERFDCFLGEEPCRCNSYGYRMTREKLSEYTLDNCRVRCCCGVASPPPEGYCTAVDQVIDPDTCSCKCDCGEWDFMGYVEFLGKIFCDCQMPSSSSSSSPNASSSTTNPNCPDLCEWMWSSDSSGGNPGTWIPTGGGTGVSRSVCQASGCDCPPPDYTPVSEFEMGNSRCD